MNFCPFSLHSCCGQIKREKPKMYDLCKLVILATLLQVSSSSINSWTTTFNTTLSASMARNLHSIDFSLAPSFHLLRPPCQQDGSNFGEKKFHVGILSWVSRWLPIRCVTSAGKRRAALQVSAFSYKCPVPLPRRINFMVSISYSIQETNPSVKSEDWTRDWDLYSQISTRVILKCQIKLDKNWQNCEVKLWENKAKQANPGQRGRLTL